MRYIPIVLQEPLKSKKEWIIQITTITGCCMRKSIMITEWWHNKAIIRIVFSRYIITHSAVWTISSSWVHYGSRYFIMKYTTTCIMDVSTHMYMYTFSLQTLSLLQLPPQVQSLSFLNVLSLVDTVVLLIHTVA